MQFSEFQHTIKDFYQHNRRDFAWRNTTDPYHIVVSEIMLQQTQTERVRVKFPAFITAFENFEQLAAASTRDILAAWQGMGYNRRALALQGIAVRVVQEFGGMLPNCPQVLESFKGIGPNTAGSICAFAFNQPTVFIETNIRAVFIHHFFKERESVHDRDIVPLVERTLDHVNPREWYYALMDYGVALKKQFKNPSRKSSHYTRQSPFEGSERQIRGMIVRALTIHRALSFALLCEVIDREPYRIERNLKDLVAEGFITQREHIFYLA